jgi:hypothetical protein
MNLTEAQKKRKIDVLELSIDKNLNSIQADSKLKGIVSFYSRIPNARKEFIRNNIKTLGPGTTERAWTQVENLIKLTVPQRQMIRMSNETPPTVDENIFSIGLEGDING